MGEDYEKLDAYHQALQPQDKPYIEILLANQNGENAENAGHACELEARWIAQRIRKMLDNKEKIVREGNSLRSVEQRDITILLRALTKVSYIERALQAYGIDY